MLHRSWSVVIPQYECIEQTIRCCETLLAVHRCEFEIVVVDDGSCPDLYHETRRELPAAVRLIRQARKGVTAAWNLGIQAAGSDAIVLLNNDVVSHEPWLLEMDELLKQKRSRLIGAAWSTEHAERNLRRRLQIPGIDVCMLEGWCLGFDRLVASDVGPFDTGMRLYYSDTDFQFRWRIRHGLQDSVMAKIRSGALSHLGHVSTRQLPDLRAIWDQDQEFFFRKWNSHCITTSSGQLRSHVPE